MNDRREFLERAGAAAMMAALPLSAKSFVNALAVPPATNSTSTDWDLSWVNRVTGKYRAVFDVPEIDSGYGVWRATIWEKQYADVLKAAPEDCSAVVVMRHKGIALAMQQSFWDKYELSKSNQVTHPITEKPTDRNPALLSSTRGEAPAETDVFALDKFIARGGVALACNLAIADMVEAVTKKDGSKSDAARAVVLASLVPGVILQPSGVFAAIHAQDAGCKYLRAS